MNDVDELIQNLESTSSYKRFKAASYFSKNHCPAAIEALRARQKVEKVKHVKMVIDRAIRRINAEEVAGIDEENFGEDADVLKQHLKSKAIDEFSGLLLHEMEPIFGLLKLSAKQELDNYEGSDTKKYLDKLRRLLSAIKKLRTAAFTSKAEEVNLSQMVADICSEEINERVDLHLEGNQPFVTLCDSNLLALALSNGIRNSTESISSCAGNDKRRIIITWGTTEVDDWVSIIDEGIGLVDSPESAFQLGNTNKNDHTGFGLTIVRQAMESMNGVAELSQSTTGGAQLILRWSFK